MNLRTLRRAVTLAFSLLLCILHFGWMRLHGPMSMVRRAQWLQAACRRVLDALGIHSAVQGTPPTHGVLVANHLSYLDILILSAATPCVFIAKAEIGKWPYFGWAARAGGTLFIRRASLASAERVSSMIAERLKQPVPILFFPEGTSTDGTSVHRFHGRLFEPAIAAQAPVTTATLRYVLSDGTPESRLCWFGDDAFLPHIYKTLGVAGFTAEVHFGVPRLYPDRRIAATATHAEISARRDSPETVLRAI